MSEAPAEGQPAMKEGAGIDKRYRETLLNGTQDNVGSSLLEAV
jgi:hypothetical protein